MSANPDPIQTPRTDSELARLLNDFDLTNIDRREAMADFARILEKELNKLGVDFGAVCRTNSQNADAMVAQAKEIKGLRGVLAWLDSHPDAIQRNTVDDEDGKNWALVFNSVAVGWFPSIEAAVAKGIEIESNLPPGALLPAPTETADSGLSFRCTQDEKDSFAKAAAAAGFPTLSAWATSVLDAAAEKELQQ